MSDYLRLFSLFFYLGCISFGGPTAHLALFQKELIDKRGWMSTTAYMQLVSLCQILPGPTSSQVGMALGYHCAGYSGAFFAWLGFTLPAALLLASIGIGITQHDAWLNTTLLHGLSLAVIAIVAHALVTMIRQICVSHWHYFIMILVTVLSLFTLTPQIILIILAALLGIIFFRQQNYAVNLNFRFISPRIAALCLLAFFTLLFLLPYWINTQSLVALFHHFYQAGALVFGGGHVVLPLLEAELSHGVWLTQEQFVAGYGIVQAMPGPLFNFASYLGAVAYQQQPIFGAVVAVIGIFLPAALILFAALAAVHYINQFNYLKSAFTGIAAGVTGMLLATLYHPLITQAILSVEDVAIVIAGFLLLYFQKIPVYLLVVLCALFAWF